MLRGGFVLSNPDIRRHYAIRPVIAKNLLPDYRDAIVQSENNQNLRIITGFAK